MGRCLKKRSIPDRLQKLLSQGVCSLTKWKKVTCRQSQTDDMGCVIAFKARCVELVSAAQLVTQTCLRRDNPEKTSAGHC